MNLFCLGANIDANVLGVLADAPDSIILYEDDEVGHVRDLVQELESRGRAACIGKRAVFRAAARASGDERERILNAVLNDFRPFLLKTRFQRIDMTGAFDSMCYFADVVDFALAFSARYQPKFVFCTYTPHTLESWLFVRTLEAAGADVMRLVLSPLPWILLPVHGLSNARDSLLTPVNRPLCHEKLARYFAMLRGEYQQAMPYYEKTQRHSIWRQLCSPDAVWRPRNILCNLEKKAVFKEYASTASRVDLTSDFGVYYLHYQPEQNTLPEAELYCDQFQTIKKLSDAMPSGMKLIVREHPSTFSKRCDRRWRPAGFYQRIALLPNVQISPLGIDAFEMMDRAVFVASIAGVCLTEALARGIPAVTFYSPRFSLFGDEDLLIDANQLSVSALKVRLQSFVGGNRRETSDEWLIACLEQVMRHGYDGSNDESFIPRSAAESYANSKRANLMAIRDVLDGTLLPSKGIR